MRIRFFQQRHLQTPDPTVFHRAFAQLPEIEPLHDLIEILPGQIVRRPGNEMECRRFERDRTDRVIGAVIAADFIDREQLH